MLDLPVRMQDARFQPFPDQPQERPIIDPFLQYGHQLIMVNGIKITFDIRFHDIAEYAKLKLERQIADRVPGPFTRTVSVRTIQKIRFVYLRQAHGHRLLDKLVHQGGSAQGPLLTVSLWNKTSFDQFRPVCVSFAGYVFPSSPSPCTWLSHAQSTMLDTTPTQPGFLQLPPWFPFLSCGYLGSAAVCIRVPLSCLRASQIICRAGVGWASQVLVSVSSYMPRLENSAGPPHPHHNGCFCVAFEYVTTLGDRDQASFRSDTSTSGSTDSPTACTILCLRFVWVVRRYVYPSQSRNTRYGWLVRTYPTGTCTPQDAPSFAWRSNGESQWKQGLPLT